ncbi:hypothetical protein HPB51_028628 [Rhipicephalus microplus]|uniref:Peptidase M13 C-terminal domain-containing protein n=1 Tax=Rhipicephalus microplus TaxID=6941 RepID=A0A9J6CWE0_RHIMP|nr:hypothetical protein HPB51_028628 [Rhipicephalus microplus]
MMMLNLFAAICKHSEAKVEPLEGLGERGRPGGNNARLCGVFFATPKYKDVKLAGFDMSPDRLFFVSDCTKWCTQSATARSPYAPMRSRCIVPLMNMPEFSSVFGCAAGAPMNPVKKCTFW